MTNKRTEATKAMMRTSNKIILSFFLFIIIFSFTIYYLPDNLQGYFTQVGRNASGSSGLDAIPENNDSGKYIAGTLIRNANKSQVDDITQKKDPKGDWVCVNVKEIDYERAVEVCKHEVGHEIFAEICEDDIETCFKVVESMKSNESRIAFQPYNSSSKVIASEDNKQLKISTKDYELVGCDGSEYINDSSDWMCFRRLER